jgi:hypothetical protein
MVVACAWACAMVSEPAANTEAATISDFFIDYSHET